MAQETDLKQRLDDVEANLHEVKTALQALLHAQLREASGAKSAQKSDAAGAWIAGELRDMTGSDVSQQEVAGYMMTSDPHNSVTWCYSRFVCVSMECGGSGWC